MKPLEPPDSYRLLAAQGWCELHAFAEAEVELDRITASLRAHPKVLEVRWQIYANLEKWADALDIANAIVKAAPEWSSGWIYRASSLTALNRQRAIGDMLFHRSNHLGCRPAWIATTCRHRAPPYRALKKATISSLRRIVKV